MSKFTKGPWHFVQYANYGQLQTEPYYNDSGDLLNEEDFSNSAANGKLAAAAPDMYTALLEARRFIGNYFPKKGNKEVDELYKLIVNTLKQATND